MIRKYHKSHRETLFATRTPRKTPAKRPQIPSKRQQIPANLRKTSQNRKTKKNVILCNSCCFPIRGNRFFQFFLLDGLTRSLKIHTQALQLCHQYAWVKRIILVWRCNGGHPRNLKIYAPQHFDIIFFNSPWFSATCRERHVFSETIWNHERLKKSCRWKIKVLYFFGVAL